MPPVNHVYRLKTPCRLCKQCEGERSSVACGPGLIYKSSSRARPGDTYAARCNYGALRPTINLRQRARTLLISHRLHSLCSCWLLARWLLWDPLLFCWPAALLRRPWGYLWDRAGPRLSAVMGQPDSHWIIILGFEEFHDHQLERKNVWWLKKYILGHLYKSITFINWGMLDLMFNACYV